MQTLHSYSAKEIIMASDLCFEFHPRWSELLPQLVQAIKNKDDGMIEAITRDLENRDRQLEESLAEGTCAPDDGGGSGGGTGTILSEVIGGGGGTIAAGDTHDFASITIPMQDAGRESFIQFSLTIGSWTPHSGNWYSAYQVQYTGGVASATTVTAQQAETISAEKQVTVGSINRVVHDGTADIEVFVRGFNYGDLQLQYIDGLMIVTV